MSSEYFQADTRGTRAKLLGCLRRPLSIVLIIAVLAVVLGVAIGVPLSRRSAEDNKGNAQESLISRARKVLQRVPLIDGHNDFPWNLRMYTEGELRNFTFNQDLRLIWKEYEHRAPSKTDLPRMRQGMVGAQFWVAYSSCTGQFKNSLHKGIEQIDLVRRLVEKQSTDMEIVTTADGIEDAFGRGKIGSLIAVEGGHMMDNDLSVLRSFYSLGVRYMSLTWSCNTPWADSYLADRNSTIYEEHHGLTDWGKLVVKEMNRLGMMIDLSHTSVDTQHSAINTSEAPVIFSHSSVYSICPHTRNVQDEVLRRMPENGGIVMVNFYNNFLNCTEENRYGDEPHHATVALVADHIEYIRNISGVNHVGIGADFDGAPYYVENLADSSEYPNLVVELLSRDWLWTEEEVEKVVGKNLLRVMRKVEEVRESLSSQPPIDKPFNFTTLDSSCYVPWR